MQERMRAIVSYVREVSEQFRMTRGSLAAGGLAYFVALSLAPAALAFGTLAGLLLDPAQVRSALDRLAQRAPEAFENIKPVTDALLSTITTASGSTFTVTTVVGLIIAIYASSRVVVGLRTAMNAAFGLTETRSGLLERAFAAVITLAGLVIAVAGVIALTAVPRILAWLDLPGVPVTTGLAIVDWLIIAALIFVVVRWLLQHGPDRRAHVSWLSPGAWIATIGITGATIGVGIYAHFSTTIGVAVLLFGSAVVILLWLYLCFVALLWGAVIEAHAAAQRAASHAAPSQQPDATAAD